MKPIVMGLAAVGLLLGGTRAGTDTALSLVTPQNIQRGTFRLTSKAVRNNAVEFVIRRDIRNIDGPSRGGYLSNPKLGEKGLETPVKQEESNKILTFRFSVPEEQVADSVFTVRGVNLRGEGITYHFALAEFRKPKKD